MRKSIPADAAASGASLPAGSRDQRPVELVCVTLALATLAIILRIASIW